MKQTQEIHSYIFTDKQTNSNTINSFNYLHLTQRASAYYQTNIRMKPPNEALVI